MRYLRILAILGIFLGTATLASAQRVVVGVGVGPGYYGPAPICAYGYYPYAPYACAPYGYYGPSWFSGGVFIGAGPWFHGFRGRGFYGGRGFVGRGGFDGRRGFEGGRGFEGRGGFRSGPVARGSGGFSHGAASGGFHGGSARGGFSGGGGHGGGHGGGRR